VAASRKREQLTTTESVFFETRDLGYGSETGQVFLPPLDGPDWTGKRPYKTPFGETVHLFDDELDQGTSDPLIEPCDVQQGDRACCYRKGHELSVFPHRFVLPDDEEPELSATEEIILRPVESLTAGMQVDLGDDPYADPDNNPCVEDEYQVVDVVERETPDCTVVHFDFLSIGFPHGHLVKVIDRTNEMLGRLETHIEALGLPLTWAPDGSGVIDGGHVGGDVQVSDCWSVRFRPSFEPDDALYAFVDENWYVEIFDHSETGGDVTYGVTCQVQFMICSDLDDAGSTEEWCDYRYHSPSMAVYKTLEEAEKEAERLARASDGTDIGWDGRTPTIT
jgi:hypothetical protein